MSSAKVAFVNANDIRVVGREGGDAPRLTSGLGGKKSPHFSSDGQWIAFTGEYEGNNDVYVIPAAGGEPRRLTWHPGADVALGWTSDGAGIIEVYNDPKSVIEGGDPQLEAAVQEALRLLRTERVELKAEPPAPIRYRRPGGGGS